MKSWRAKEWGGAILYTVVALYLVIQLFGSGIFNSGITWIQDSLSSIQASSESSIDSKYLAACELLEDYQDLNIPAPGYQFLEAGEWLTPLGYLEESLNLLDESSSSTASDFKTALLSAINFPGKVRNSQLPSSASIYELSLNYCGTSSE